MENSSITRIYISSDSEDDDEIYDPEQNYVQNDIQIKTEIINLTDIDDEIIALSPNIIIHNNDSDIEMVNQEDIEHVEDDDSKIDNIVSNANKNTSADIYDSENDDVSICDYKKNDAVTMNFNDEDIIALKNPSDKGFAELAMKFNTIIKCTYLPHGDTGYYIWSEKVKLWKQSDYRGLKKNILYIRALYDILESVIIAASNQDLISNEEYDELKSTISKASKIKSCAQFFYIDTDESLEKKINAHPYELPIKPNKIINVKTLQVRERTKDDLWSFEFKHNFKANQSNQENKLHKFLWSMWGDQTEFAYFKKLCGKLLSCDTKENILMVLQQNQGGGGKTIFVSVIQEVFAPFCCQLSRKVLLYGDGNIDAELCKLRCKRMAFIDEALQSQKNADKEKTKEPNLSTIFDVCGGGLISPRDAHQSGHSVRAFRCIASLCLVGNNLLFNIDQSSALNRRMINACIRTYYRNPTDVGYNKDDIWCKPKNPNIKDELLENQDDVFTFMVKTFHEYLQNNDTQLIMDTIPQRWRKIWKSTFNKENAINTFIDQYCYKKSGSKVKLPRFIQSLNAYKKTTFFCETNIKKYIKEIPDIRYSEEIYWGRKEKYVSGLGWSLVIE